MLSRDGLPVSPSARVRSCLAAALLAWAASAGCGGEGAGVAPVSGSTEEATVTGIVTLRGRPVNNGNVLFSPVNIKRVHVQPRQAPIGKDGRYTLKTLVGDNYVQIDCRELRMPRNRDIADTERAVIVNSGENTIDLKIPPE